MEIRGKVALVTGAASGIGRATALALAGEGASLAVADLDQAGGEETVRQVKAAGGRAAFIRADVSTAAGIGAMFDAVEAAFGGVDIVHNNAGIMTGGTPNWPDCSNEQIALVVAVNVAGVMMGTHEAIQRMRKRGGGVVVNTASMAAHVKMYHDPVYAGTKAGVAHFTQSCANLAETEKVRVNAVLPGMVDTPIIAKSGDGRTPAEWLRPWIAQTKMLPPEAIAAAVVEFVKDDSKAGETVSVANER
jgi:3-oxoacyl-[acyl-carrier protein] reductase